MKTIVNRIYNYANVKVVYNEYIFCCFFKPKKYVRFIHLLFLIL